MAFIISDGRGSGNQTKVTNEGALQIIGETHHLQHHFSRVYGQAYQTLSVTSFSTSGSHSLLHIKNNSSTLLTAFTYFRIQPIEFTGLPASTDYVSIGFGKQYSSGGVEITPINLNGKSGNQADVTCYREATTTGTLSEFDRWYLASNGTEERYEKWGSILLGQNDTLEMLLTTINTSGVIKVRATFVMLTEGL